MQLGRSYEQFEVPATYRHWPGKTVAEQAYPDEHGGEQPGRPVTAEEPA